MNEFSRFTITLAALCIVLSGSAQVASESATAASGNAENGKRLYVKNGCYECHSYDGHGGAGARLDQSPLPVQAFIAYVRHPAPGNMPVYTIKVMSNAELTDVWTFLKTIPKSPAAKDVPLLNQN
jgi:mono/diheme cytochrome c family protein